MRTANLAKTSFPAADGADRMGIVGPASPSLECPEYPDQVQSLLGVLQYQRKHMPERPVCHRIVRQRRSLDSEPMSVAQLIDRASLAAAVLRTCGVKEGDRVLLSLSDPHDFLVAFFGSLMAGASAVPLPTAGESGAPRSFATRVRGVCHDCAPSLAVVDNARRFGDAVGADLPTLVVVEPSALAIPQAGAAMELRDRPASVPAFIQYTSGSTGSPKGVVVTHGNLMANCRAIRDATGYTRADRMVSWLPLHHDMGLVGGLLTSIYCAAETWLMPPMTFLARPVTWLEAMTAFAATLTIAPTFAYGLCARKIPDKQLQGVDLSSLRLAYIGAEPIHPVTLTAFLARYAQYGLPAGAMYPVYGLAEATLAVAFPPPGRAIRYDTVDRGLLAASGVAAPVDSAHPDGVTFVSVGSPLPRHRVEILSRDSGEPLAERQVGELVFEGDSVTPRYFGDEQLPARASLRTGDLAYVADGEIYIVDRIKDLVILAGQNHAPSDIEGEVAEVAGLRRGRIVAFSTAGGSGVEELHVVAEASPHAWRAPDEIVHDVRRRLLQNIGLSVATVTIVVPGSLERTSSGKMKRRACVEAFTAEKLQVVRTRSDLGSGGILGRAGQMLSAAGDRIAALLGRAS